MNTDVKNIHKMRKVTIYRAKSRELLLGYKLAAFHESEIQRPLRRDRDASDDYTLVVYGQAYAHHIHGEDDYKTVRLVSGTSGRKEERSISRQVFRNMMRDIQVHTCPDDLDELDLPTGVTDRLKVNGITGICHLLEYTSREIQKFPGIGKKYMEYIVEGLRKKNLKLNPF
jgi:hypothetical protein